MTTIYNYSLDGYLAIPVKIVLIVTSHRKDLLSSTNHYYEQKIIHINNLHRVTALYYK